MSGLKLPRLLSDGVILQRNKRIHIWGLCNSGSEVTVSLNGEAVTVLADSANHFDAYLKPMEAGGPYKLIVSDETETCTVNDVLIGDVFMMCGQSNMEFPMNRVRDTFPEEWGDKLYHDLRIYKITERCEFSGPLEDLETGSWDKISPDIIGDAPAIAYFFCKLLKEETGVPVGVINASLGGSPIEAWMSEEMLEDYPEALELANRYKDSAFVQSVLENNARINNEWRNRLDEVDPGVIANWQNEDSLEGLPTVSLPDFFENNEIGGHIGSVWLYKEFEAGEELLQSDSSLWLGTLTDSDITYVNGTEVGRTEYKYPPRRYRVAKELLHRGRNIIAVRLRIETGVGRVTPGKLLAIFTGDVKRRMEGNKERIEGAKYCLDLSGEWAYRMGGRMPKIEPTDFVSWKPTGLYNGMLHACTNLSIAAFIFYQGESNTDPSLAYYDRMTVSQVTKLRELWQDEKLPYIYTRLPNFLLNGYEKEVVNKYDTAWEELKVVQGRIAQMLPYAYMVDTDGMGEDNDVHPQDKKSVAAEYVCVIMDNKLVK